MLQLENNGLRFLQPQYLMNTGTQSNQYYDETNNHILRLSSHALSYFLSFNFYYKINFMCIMKKHFLLFNKIPVHTDFLFFFYNYYFIKIHIFYYYL